MDVKKQIIKINETINKSLQGLKKYLENHHDLICLYENIYEFLNRKAKRIRPLFLLLGYRGYSDENNEDIYVAAAAIEIIHAFILIHDDIIDNDDIRRQKPSMHKILEKKYLNGEIGKKLGIICGDLLYSYGLKLFMDINFDNGKKNKALDTILKAALYTGCGEHLELVKSIQSVNKAELEKIYDIYALKTAYYTFVFPLIAGATLAGAPQGEYEKLKQFGLNLGIAFQIHDDINGLFFEKDSYGNPSLNDLNEAKKTSLLRYCYEQSNNQIKKQIDEILNKDEIDISDLKTIRKHVETTGSLEFALKEIDNFKQRAFSTASGLNLNEDAKQTLNKIITIIFSKNY